MSVARRPLIAGNWKMHKNGAEAAETCGRLRALVGNQPSTEVVVCPPFTAIHAAVDALAGSEIWVAAQSVHEQAQGAHTGEISAPMLVAAGCRGAIIGHSERRAAGETDSQVAARIQTAMANDLIPIACVGESLETREAGETDAWLARQVRALLAGVRPDQADRLVIAYEPIWAIGTGKTATPEMAQEACALVRRTVDESHAADLVRVLYGGSVNPANAAELMSQGDVDGALVGGASLDADSFAAVVEAVG